MQIIIGIITSLIVSILAWKAGALNRTGMWAAVISGGLIFSFGGLPWAVLLLTFFISSSLLSRLLASRKISLGEKFSKGSQRDWGQVLANSGLGAIFAVAFSFTSNSELWIAYAGAVAAVNSDTWATEVGVLSTSPPRLITNGKVVDHGTSGGISFLGSLFAFLGSLLIGLLTAVLTSSLGFIMTNSLLLIVIILIGGIGGAFFDSLLGATVQAIYTCPTCNKETERYPNHTCGSKTIHIRGWSWLNNDIVNFLCSSVGALLSFLGYILFF
jgi:uncharacterized protein (TIGR00297 family)